MPLLCRPPLVADLVAVVDDAAGVEEVAGVGVVPPPPALSPRPPVVLPVLVLPRLGVGVGAAGVLDDAALLVEAPSFTTAVAEALAETVVDAAEDAAGGSWEALATGEPLFPPPAPVKG